MHLSGAGYPALRRQSGAAAESERRPGRLLGFLVFPSRSASSINLCKTLRYFAVFAEELLHFSIPSAPARSSELTIVFKFERIFEERNCGRR